MNTSPLLKHVNIKTYTIGFILSLIFTFVAFGITKYASINKNIFSNIDFIIIVIIVLALFQLSVQLIFFMHLLKEKKPYWGVIFFISTVGLILIIVIGSVWILNNLNYHMMPMDVGEYIRIDEGIKPTN